MDAMEANLRTVILRDLVAELGLLRDGKAAQMGNPLEDMEKGPEMKLFDPVGLYNKTLVE